MAPISYDQVIANTAQQKLNLGRPRLRLLPKPAQALSLKETLAWARETAPLRRKAWHTPSPAPQSAHTWSREFIPDAQLDALIRPHLPATMKELVFATGLAWRTIRRRLDLIAEQERIMVGSRVMHLYKAKTAPKLNPKDGPAVRAALLDLLPASAEALAKATDLSISSVRHRLKELRAAGLVIDTRSDQGFHTTTWSRAEQLQKAS